MLEVAPEKEEDVPVFASPGWGLQRHGRILKTISDECKRKSHDRVFKRGDSRR